MTSFDPVDWALADKIGRRFAGRNRASLPTPDPRLPDQFAALVATAEPLVAAETGLLSLDGPATARVVSREDWVSVNIGSFRRLLGPMIERWGAKSSVRGGIGGSIAKGATRTIAGTELGMLLGWMSHRVIGQYDVLIGGEGGGDKGGDGGPADADAGDIVYVVGPNVQAVEHKYGFEPEQFRLWVALHECTHRAQFTGVPWMRAHFRALVDEVLVAADPDPAQLFGAARAALTDRAETRRRLREGGAVALVASPAQRAAMARIGGMMSLLEGHGDVVMDRAGAGFVPDAERFSRVLSARRRQANPVARIVQRLVGIEAKLQQYAAGERFIAAVEDHGGRSAIDVCWTSPDALPSMDEIRTPSVWLDRLAVPRAAAAVVVA